MSGENNKGKPLARKPSFKNRKPPEVRQTLTSKYRLLKANPLLMKAIAQEDKELLLNKPLKTLAMALGNGKLPTESGTQIKSVPEFTATKPTTDIQRKMEILTKPRAHFNNSHSSRIDFRTDQFLSSTVLESRRESIKQANFNKSTSSKRLTNVRPSNSVMGATKKEMNSRLSMSTNKPLVNGKSTFSARSSTQVRPQNMNKTSVDNKHKKPLRRSLSAQHFDRKKMETFQQLSTCNSHPRQAHSSEDLKIESDKGKQITNETEETNFSTITEEGRSFNTPREVPTPKFKTLVPHNRRSIKTPNTTNNRKSLFFLTPTSNEISEKLNEWLKRRGKSLGDFHHLKCFGIHNQNAKRTVTKVDEENKENVEVNPKDDSYEELRITVPQNVNNNTEFETVNKEVVAKEALQDLHKLILEGYPSDQCEVWLRLIKQKYKQLEEDPQYWECRAAIEQSKGNINMAVECYKTAIVQGAEVQAVDESLDQLLQKFSLLNINSKEANTQDRARIVEQARNIFKSSIIQFAVQERTLKTKNKDGIKIEKTLVATPVRRSTRSSRSAYTSTPGVAIYSSLQDVDPNIRDSINFRQNKALN